SAWWYFIRSAWREMAKVCSGVRWRLAKRLAVSSLSGSGSIRAVSFWSSLVAWLLGVIDFNQPFILCHSVLIPGSLVSRASISTAEFQVVLGLVLVRFLRFFGFGGVFVAGFGFFFDFLLGFLVDFGEFFFGFLGNLAFLVSGVGVEEGNNGVKTNDRRSFVFFLLRG
ncbi:12910_t:CDS:2, partial [Entrophospora sp. SA101]